MKKILIISWRDPKSPLEGGAERITRRYAEFWAKTNDVYWLTNKFVGSSSVEQTNNVTYLRVGPTLDGSIARYLLIFVPFLFKVILKAIKIINEKKIDVVIDAIHGIPYFSPFYSNSRNILLVCEVAGPIWQKMFPFPINLIGSWIERNVYQIYKKSEIWAISVKTKNDILELLPGNEVAVIPLGIDIDVELTTELGHLPKTTYPSAVFLARLVKMKGIERAIEATRKLVVDMPTFTLFVIGGGTSTYADHLHKMVAEYQLEENIKFLGKVSERKKFEYLRKAHFLLHLSYKEGFGLTVLEAGLVGTPSIVSLGSGLEDLVQHKVNGYVVADLEEISQIYRNHNVSNTSYKMLAQNAALNAKRHGWSTVLGESNGLV